MMGARDLAQGREAHTPPLDDLPVVIPFRGLAGARGGVGAGEGGDMRMAEGEGVEQTESREAEAGDESQEVTMLESMEVDNVKPDREREQSGKRKQDGGGRLQSEIKKSQTARGVEEIDEEETERGAGVTEQQEREWLPAKRQLRSGNPARADASLLMHFWEGGGETSDEGRGGVGEVEEGKGAAIKGRGQVRQKDPSAPATGREVLRKPVGGQGGQRDIRAWVQPGFEEERGAATDEQGGEPTRAQGEGRRKDGEDRGGRRGRRRRRWRARDQRRYRKGQRRRRGREHRSW